MSLFELKGERVVRRRNKTIKGLENNSDYINVKNNETMEKEIFPFKQSKKILSTLCAECL